MFIINNFINFSSFLPNGTFKSSINSTIYIIRTKLKKLVENASLFKNILLLLITFENNLGFEQIMKQKSQ